MKKCNRCGKTKKISEFYKRTDRNNLHRPECKKCTSSKNTAYARIHPNKKTRLAARQWVIDNPEKHRISVKRYYKNHPGKREAGCALRRATLLQATPPWLTKEMKTDIDFFYIIRKTMKKPKDWNVDHIVPLLAPNARGLHVPWNLQLMKASDNQSKKNKI